MRRDIPDSTEPPPFRNGEDERTRITRLEGEAAEFRRALKTGSIAITDNRNAISAVEGRLDTKLEKRDAWWKWLLATFGAAAIGFIYQQATKPDMPAIKSEIVEVFARCVSTETYQAHRETAQRELADLRVTITKLAGEVALIGATRAPATGKGKGR